MLQSTTMERHPLVRIAKIDQCLRCKSYCSANYLMSEVGISRRTLFRDIRTLEDMGAPISYSREYKGYFYVAGTKFKLPEVSLTEGDIFAIILTEQAINSMDKNYLSKKLESSMAKLRIMFQKKVKIPPSEIFSFSSFAQSPLNAQIVQNIELIIKALDQKKKIHCFYKKPSSAKAQAVTIEPYHLHFRGKWYLFGWSESSKDYRTYVVQRIEKIELSQKNFVGRQFDLKQHLGDAWEIAKGKTTTVEVEFPEDYYAYITEKIWHPSQKITKQKNGKIRMTLTVDGLHEIIWWVLSFGSTIKVIRPKELITAVKTEAKKINNKYK